MTDHPEDDLPPTEGPPIDDVVEQYLFRLKRGEVLSITAFSRNYPEELREEIRRRCREVLQVRRAVQKLGSEDPDQADWIGEFRLEGVIGRGSFGVVHLAWQSSLDRKVALKVLAVNPDVQARSVERFRREAVAAGKLRHPNIVPVHSVGEEAGTLFLVMDYIEGPTLGRALEDMKDEIHAGAAAEPDSAGSRTASTSSCLGSASQRGYPGRVAAIIADLADALQFAHDHEIIHRDIKPQNILMDADGKPYLADFGLAKDLSEISLSQVGDHAGSPPYMSPEQAMAKRVPIDHRTDVFSLGVVMYEMLALKRPFKGDSLARLFYEISFKEPTKLRNANPRIPRDLETICHKALQKNPDDRFQDAGEMARNLRRFLNHESILIQPPSWRERAWRAALRHRVAVGLAAVAVVAVVVSVFVMKHIMRAEELARMVQPLRVLASKPDLAAVPPQELLRASRSAAAAATEIEAFASSDREIVVGQRDRLIRFGETEIRGALTNLEAAFAGRLGTPCDRLLGFAAGFRRLLVGSLLLPKDRVQPFTSSKTWYPRISVRSIPERAQVSLHKLNPATDEVVATRALGETPVRDALVAPGLYRIVVRNSGFGASEYVRHLSRPRQHVDLGVVELRANADPRNSKMIRIAGGDFVFGKGSEGGNRPYHQRTVRGAAFLIDATEVTNAQYREFVKATGARAPGIWPSPYDPKYDDLPVVGVGFFEARAYAEWRGVRLPTAREWERAARGTNGLDRPAAKPDYEGYALFDPARPLLRMEMRRGAEQRFASARPIYLRDARPVSRATPDVSPAGLLHALGNAREWTDSLMFMRDSATGVPVMQPAMRIAKGGSFLTPRARASLAELVPTPVEVRDPSLGFRCARSVLE